MFTTPPQENNRSMSPLPALCKSREVHIFSLKDLRSYLITLLLCLRKNATYPLNNLQGREGRGSMVKHILISTLLALGLISTTKIKHYKVLVFVLVASSESQHRVKLRMQQQNQQQKSR